MFMPRNTVSKIFFSGIGVPLWPIVQIAVGEDKVNRRKREALVRLTDSSEQQDDREDYRLRCPSCGKNISRLSKLWDTVMAWYSDSYRLIRCRKCGTWFAARRKRSTTN